MRGKLVEGPLKIHPWGELEESGERTSDGDSRCQIDVDVGGGVEAEGWLGQKKGREKKEERGRTGEEEGRKMRVREKKGVEARGEILAKKTRGSRKRVPPQRRIFGYAAIVMRGRGRADARKEKSTRSAGMKSSARAP